jgi:hypothetical protein
MGRAVRWLIAGLVTAAAFGLSTWVAGVLVLPPLMESAADRWVVAAGLGVAVAALVGLWGDSWAKQRTPSRSANPGGSSIVTGGSLTGIASIGDHNTNTQQPKTDAQPATPAENKPQVPVLPAPDEATVAPGERSIAAGGDISGIANIGGDTTNTQ